MANPPTMPTVGTSIGATALNEAPTPIDDGTKGLIYTAMQGVPSTKLSAGYSMMRGYNTIMRGGWGTMADQSFVGSTLNWRSFFRYPTMANFGANESIYSTYNAAGMATRAATKLGEWNVPGFGGFSRTRPFMTNGAMGQWAAGQRLGSMGEKSIGDTLAGNLNEFAGHINMHAPEELAKGAMPSPLYPEAPPPSELFTAGMSGNEASRVLAMQGGAVNQAVGGFFTGTRQGYESLVGSSMGTTYDRAATFAAKHFGPEAIEAIGEKFALEGGLKLGAEYAGKLGVSMGVKALGLATPLAPVFAAWMAYDLAKTGAELVNQMVIKPTIDLVKSGARSLQGQLGKAPMGMGYKDNEVAATSRARGVQAIQNSRLNARSILGSEAGMLYQHFG